METTKSTAMEFPKETLQALDDYIESLDDEQGLLIHILHKAQELFGYLPQDLQLYIARKLDIPAAKVFGVVSFYSFFAQEKRGKHNVSICMGTACFVQGAERVYDALCSALGVEAGGTSEDGLFTLNAVRCIGACGLAPVALIDDKVYGHLSEEKIKDIINEYREGMQDEDQYAESAV